MVINSISQITNSKSTTETVTKDNQSMGKDDFMKLMVAQLKYQNPMEPAKDLDFIAQTAQFSSLEQMTNLNNKVIELISSNKQLYANTMIGRQITWADADDNIKTGVVSKVELNDGEPVLIANSEKVSLDWIINVSYQSQAAGS
jgi:flagellar basal-body rod modification protein FlgD